MKGLATGKHILIVGLGNPGSKYARHRHNIGFMVVDVLARDEGSTWAADKEKAVVAPFPPIRTVATLVKPQTYMNLSGRAVAPLARRFNADPGNMIVIQDDMDLSHGRIRIKKGGGDGGHKGIRSICDSLRFRDFIRVRMGVGRPPEGINPESYVLSNIEDDADFSVESFIAEGAEAVRLILTHGFEKAQNSVHSKRERAPESISGT